MNVSSKMKYHNKIKENKMIPFIIRYSSKNKEFNKKIV